MMQRRWMRLAAPLACILLAGRAMAQIGPAAVLSPPVIAGSLHAAELALVINENDPASVETGQYYQARRGIPSKNVVRVRFPAGVSALTQNEFEALYREVKLLTPEHVQAFALAWTRPYRVGCAGMTSAFAFGPEAAHCPVSCAPTRVSPYFDAPGVAPWAEHRMRPAMMLAARSVGEARALVDRGIASDYTYPNGTAYLASTGDKARSVRDAGFAAVAERVGRAFAVERVAGVLLKRDDVLAYFTGLVDVPGLDTLRFHPGAVADHLTSFGGQLTDSSQMSALRWLGAGATGSYGTVSEPCAFAQKFPHPGVFLMHYLDGETLIEAYWKSVAWPLEGVFVGEPLARPFGPRVSMGRKGWELEAYSPLASRRYLVRPSMEAAGPAAAGGTILLAPGRNRIPLPSFGGDATIDPYPPRPGAAQLR